MRKAAERRRKELEADLDRATIAAATGYRVAIDPKAARAWRAARRSRIQREQRTSGRQMQTVAQYQRTLARLARAGIVRDRRAEPDARSSDDASRGSAGDGSGSDS